MAHVAMTGPGSRWIWRLLAGLCVVLPTALHAASVTVSGNDPRKDITVAIDQASVDFVLDDLHKKYGFEVTGPKIEGESELQTVTMSGSLQSILERLLRNWNHLIVRSPDNASGIAKVMILNSVYGATPPAPPPPPANVEPGIGAGASNMQQAQRQYYD